MFQIATGPWVKSTFSAQGNCVEVFDPGVYVRNSNDPHGPAIHFTRPEWNAFLLGVKHGEFDSGLTLAA